MANSNHRGNTYEIEVKNILESEGWIVFRQHRKQMYINGKMIMVGCDVFGSDLIAKKAGHPTLWVQVTTRTQKSVKSKMLLEQPWTYGHDRVQLWLREAGSRLFEIFEAPAFESVGIKKAI